MTDDELTPAQQDRVRRLLAAARHDEPMPVEVAARLEGVLADLGEQPTATVTSLDAVRRRRRRGAAFLVAAAAVTVIGLGAKPLLTSITPAAEDAKTSSGAADNDLGDAPGGAPEVGGAKSQDAFAAYRFAVTSDSFDRDVRRLAHGLATGKTDAMIQDLARQDGVEPAPTEASCQRQRAWGKGYLLWASYDDAPGALLFRAPVGLSQRVDLFLCGQRTPERTTFVRAP